MGDALLSKPLIRKVQGMRVSAVRRAPILFPIDGSMILPPTPSYFASIHKDGINKNISALTPKGNASVYFSTPAQRKGKKMTKNKSQMNRPLFQPRRR